MFYIHRADGCLTDPNLCFPSRSSCSDCSKTENKNLSESFTFGSATWTKSYQKILNACTTLNILLNWFIFNISLIIRPDVNLMVKFWWIHDWNRQNINKNTNLFIFSVFWRDCRVSCEFFVYKIVTTKFINYI